MKKYIYSLVFILAMLNVPNVNSAFDSDLDLEEVERKVPQKKLDVSKKKARNERNSQTLFRSALEEALAYIEKIKEFPKRTSKPMYLHWKKISAYNPDSYGHGFIAPQHIQYFSSTATDDSSAPPPPAAYDVRSYLTSNASKWESLWPVQNQGSLNSCVSNAITAAIEFDWLVWNYVMYKKVEKVPFSRLFLYYNARGGVAHDNGISVTAGIGAFSGDKPRPRDVLYIHDRKGCCKEEIWPYEKDYTAKPNDTAYTDAMNYQVHPASSDVSFTKLNDNTDVPYDTVKLRAIKKALYENNRPVPFGLFLMGYEATRAFRGLVGESSMISTPSITCAEYIKQEKNRMKALGKTETEIDKMHFTPGHSMLIVGYNDTTKLFTLRNSYGSLWGDNGYCRASYDLILSNWAQDFWVMKRSV